MNQNYDLNGNVKSFMSLKGIYYKKAESLKLRYIQEGQQILPC